MADYFDKMKFRRSVLVRTKTRPDLPEAVLFIGGFVGDGKRAVLGTDRKEQRLAEAILQSHYKLATGQEADDLIATHWRNDVYAPPAPVVNPPEPVAAPRKEAAPKKQAAAKPKAAKKPAKKRK